jgi:hypothetical protein
MTTLDPMTGAPGFTPPPQVDAMEGVPGDINQQLVDTDWWTDEMVQRSGMPIFDVPMVTVGGGLGSFVLTHILRVAGLPKESIRALTVLDYPHQTYEYLTGNSQIPLQARIRSDSGSMLDNIWGFPGYAIREAFDPKLRKQLGATTGLSGFIGPLWSAFTEPVFVDYWTPLAGQVFKSVRREMARLDWTSMISKGQVRMIRRRYGGGYFTVLTPPPGSYPTKRVAFRSRFVHIAVGYPGLRYLPDLQAYREQYRDYARVINAYEPHEHIYQELVAHGGTVVVRGSGIVASRILQRLMDDIEQKGARTQILHLFRNYVSSSHGDSIFNRRKGADGWAYQGFNYAKSSWGGQLFDKIRKEDDPAKRADMLHRAGGTNTPYRKYWQKQMARGRKAGWYRVEVGEVQDVVPGPDGKVITRIRTTQVAGIREIPADYIIDATGLEGDPKEHRVLSDLLEHGGAGLNGLGRLDVDRDAELVGTRSEPGRIYATGSTTLGGYLAPVDTFLGLQLAGLIVCDALAAQGFVKKIGPARSISQWIKWARNKQP